ncbi:MAG TPA: hypothetical protein VNA28_12590 [Solirubrobacteraceae bacterium]|nr:hypothetical protein [Solirubrobacteraceae bacterium]
MDVDTRAGDVDRAPVDRVRRSREVRGLQTRIDGATAMIDGLWAGTPTKPSLPRERLALLPAAAMISVPAASARLPTVS